MGQTFKAYDSEPDNITGPIYTRTGWVFSWTGSMALTLAADCRISLSMHPGFRGADQMFLVLLALVCVVPTTLAQCLTQNDVPYNHNRESHQELIRSQLDFSLNLFKAVGKQQPSENIFISPVSIYNAMLLAYFTAKGHTETNIHKALFLPKSIDKTNMMLAYQVQKKQTLPGGYKSEVNSVNRFFVSINQTVRDCMEELFYDEIEMVDFSERKLNETANIINRWVANKTKNKIQELVSADSLSPGTQLVLANAAYFKGVWKYQFNEEDTRPSKFYVSQNKSVPVDMMFQLNTFSHWRSEQLEAEILELPFKGSEISLILMLPDPSLVTQVATKLLSRLDSSTLLNIIKESTDVNNQEKVEVKLPKFNVEKTLELAPILESLGVGDLFNSTSDLTGLTGGPRIFLNSAIHKAIIQVDEKGTEAAAATAFTDTRIPANGFICDRPFIYLLYDKAAKTLMFSGVFNDPSK